MRTLKGLAIVLAGKDISLQAFTRKEVNKSNTIPDYMPAFAY